MSVKYSRAGVEKNAIFDHCLPISKMTLNTNGIIGNLVKC